MPSRIHFVGDKRLDVQQSAEEVMARLKSGPGQLHRAGEERRPVVVFPGHVLHVEDYDPDAIPVVAPG